MSADNPTRARLLDAALALVAADGVQAVTHRRVEDRAGVARGSTRYHFGSRDALLEALIGHLAERDHRLVADAMTALAAAGDDGTPPDLASARAAVAALVATMMADRDAALARFELYLYAARRPALAEVVSRWGETFVRAGADVLGEDGDAQAAMLSASLDGLVLHAVCSPSPALVDAAPGWYADLAASQRSPVPGTPQP